MRFEIQTYGELLDLLPSGSGFDCDWYHGAYRLVEKADDKIRKGISWIKTDFHCMNEAGYYCGYLPFKVEFCFDGKALLLYDVYINKKIQKSIEKETEFFDCGEKVPGIWIDESFLFDSIDSNMQFFYNLKKERKILPLAMQSSIS